MIGDALGTDVEVLGFEYAGQCGAALVGFAGLVDRKAGQTLIGSAVSSRDHGLQCVFACLLRCIVDGEGGFRLSRKQVVPKVQVNVVDGLGLQASLYLDGHRGILCDGDSGGLHVDGCFFHHPGEGTLGILGGIALHIFAQPGHSGAVLAVLDDARIAVGHPGLAVDIAPQRDAGTVVGLPHEGNLILVLLQLLVVISRTDVVLCDIHRHLQRILDFGH